VHHVDTVLLECKQRVVIGAAASDLAAASNLKELRYCITSYDISILSQGLPADASHVVCECKKWQFERAQCGSGHSA